MWKAKADEMTDQEEYFTLSCSSFLTAENLLQASCIVRAALISLKSQSMYNYSKLKNLQLPGKI